MYDDFGDSRAGNDRWLGSACRQEHRVVCKDFRGHLQTVQLSSYCHARQSAWGHLPGVAKAYARKFITSAIIDSFSSGRDSAIISATATSVLSETRFSIPLNSKPLRSRK